MQRGSAATRRMLAQSCGPSWECSGWTPLLHQIFECSRAIRRASRQAAVVVEMVIAPLTPACAALARTSGTRPSKSGNVRWQCVSVTMDDRGTGGAPVSIQSPRHGGPMTTATRPAPLLARFLVAAAALLLPLRALAGDYDRWYTVELRGRHCGYMHASQQTRDG